MYKLKQKKKAIVNAETMVPKIMTKIYKISVHLVVNEILTLTLYFVFFKVNGEGMRACCAINGKYGKCIIIKFIYIINNYTV